MTIRIYLTHTPRELEQYYGTRALDALRSLAPVQFNHRHIPPTPEELVEAARDCQIIISARSVPGPARVFEALPQLAAFCRVAVDISNIDVDAASRHGVLVTRATPGFDASVAEWIIGAMIDLGRGISRAAAAYWRGGSPAIQMGGQLAGATVGVIGYGFIGAYLARTALALGMRVLVNDPHAEVPAQPGLEQVPLDALLSGADYVVCLASALPETANLINADTLARMRRGAFFINAARGELVDEQALRSALDSGHLGGAALDVGRAPDQMPSASLAAHPRVVATPHIGGLTPAATEHQAMDTVRQVAALLAGQTPPYAVNAAEATRWTALQA